MSVWVFVETHVLHCAECVTTTSWLNLCCWGTRITQMLGNSPRNSLKHRTNYCMFWFISPTPFDFISIIIYFLDSCQKVLWKDKLLHHKLGVMTDTNCINLLFCSFLLAFSLLIGKWMIVIHDSKHFIPLLFSFWFLYGCLSILFHRYVDSFIPSSFAYSILCSSCNWLVSSIILLFFTFIISPTSRVFVRRNFTSSINTFIPPSSSSSWSLHYTTILLLSSITI